MELDHEALDCPRRHVVIQIERAAAVGPASERQCSTNTWQPELMCPAPALATGVDPGLRYAGQTAGSIPQRLKGRRTLGIALGDLQPGLFTEPSFGPYCVTGVFPVKPCQVEMALGLRDTLPSGQLKDLKQRIIGGSVV
ncbi:hypothetical protein CABS01_02421 [Colletotrichum abscissum]|uniref:Uncharacterized protein n=1 Tax=Colletotrichum abscissum TaxID=1671311 RepID=A0A9P9XSH8_9PEZI|nr:uncharacterized protein CABS01_02421 [Colletotrichum abscissum]KAI3559194.1 hypothetical protein CABS02_00169 [Colletotrichum abscissum]KAK1488791.1 hypothetical protein CABS01_02421 [Colletotrichum abscissum]